MGNKRDQAKLHTKNAGSAKRRESAARNIANETIRSVNDAFSITVSLRAPLSRECVKDRKENHSDQHEFNWKI